PDKNSPVIVTANYKLTFDVVRNAISGMNLWMLVLNTHGVNVWCAAGKGTFGTGEIARMVKMTKLATIVSHRNLIVPQLGAPGVSAQD
ncbi:acetyl-CoA synthase subunit gamma, partial [Citrobacter sp. AAK_AS5]